MPHKASRTHRRRVAVKKKAEEPKKSGLIARAKKAIKAGAPPIPPNRTPSEAVGSAPQGGGGPKVAPRSRAREAAPSRPLPRIGRSKKTGPRV